jgi:hypothetical protein
MLRAFTSCRTGRKVGYRQNVRGSVLWDDRLSLEVPKSMTRRSPRLLGRTRLRGLSLKTESFRTCPRVRTEEYLYPGCSP